MESPHILLLQLMMDKGEIIIPILEKVFSGWYFVALDAYSLLGGLIFGVNHTLVIEGSFVCSSSLCLEEFSKEWDSHFIVLKKYGLYENCNSFWESFD